MRLCECSLLAAMSLLSLWNSVAPPDVYQPKQKDELQTQWIVITDAAVQGPGEHSAGPAPRWSQDAGPMTQGHEGREAGLVSEWIGSSRGLLCQCVCGGRLGFLHSKPWGISLHFPLPIQVQWGCLGCLLRVLSPGE